MNIYLNILEIERMKKISDEFLAIQIYPTTSKIVHLVGY